MPFQRWWHVRFYRSTASLLPQIRRHNELPAIMAVWILIRVAISRRAQQTLFARKICINISTTTSPIKVCMANVRTERKIENAFVYYGVWRTLFHLCGIHNMWKKSNGWNRNGKNQTDQIEWKNNESTINYVHACKYEIKKNRKKEETSKRHNRKYYRFVFKQPTNNHTNRITHTQKSILQNANWHGKPICRILIAPIVHFCIEWRNFALHPIHQKPFVRLLQTQTLHQRTKYYTFIFDIEWFVIQFVRQTR